MNEEKKTQNALLETIDIMIKNKLKNLGFNYYVDGVIQDGVMQNNNLKNRDDGQNTYNVLINGTVYHDIPSMEKLDYCKGDVVQVLIKNGNWSKKFISGMSKHTKFPTAQQFNSVDKSGVEYPLICDNTSNLWIGALKKKSRHHHGQTILSTGYDTANKKGYDTIYVVVPNADNTDGSRYDMLHSGNLDKVDNHLKNYFDNNLKNYMLNIVYPVGSIYMSVNNVSPQTFLGGTWTVWGEGRTVVGVNVSDSTDSDFGMIEKKGGERTHTLKTSETPKHSHTLTPKGSISTKSLTGKFWNTAVQSVNTGLSADGVFTAQIADASGAPYPASGTGFSVGQNDGVSIDATHNHTFTGSQGTTSEVGGNSAHNNLQPYITCYMWKRIQ